MKPILFSTEMVRVILDDRKTQTRRVIKPQFSQVWGQGIRHGADKYAVHVDIAEDDSGLWKWIKCPYGAPGDLLYVRETWALICEDLPCDCVSDEHHYVEYKADTGNPYPGGWPIDEAKGNPDAPKWRPSIHMPKKFARIFLRVTDVRVERLQDITPLEVLAEGVVPRAVEDDRIVVSGFEDLWDSTTKDHKWDSNPWVWVIEFEREPR